MPCRPCIFVKRERERKRDRWYMKRDKMGLKLKLLRVLGIDPSHDVLVAIL